MNQRLFITRQLTAHHPTRHALEAKGYYVQGWSLLSFSPVKVSEIPACDWVFAYSSRGLLSLSSSLLDGFRQNKSCRFAAMGTGTAQAFEAEGIPVDFIGEGSPAEVAAAFAKTLNLDAERPKVVFLQAKNSRRSIATHLAKMLEVIEVVSYSNTIDQEADVPEAEVYFCTSPLNAEAVLLQVKDPKKCTFWAIGETTKHFLGQRGIDAEIHNLKDV